MQGWAKALVGAGARALEDPGSARSVGAALLAVPPREAGRRGSPPRSCRLRLEPPRLGHDIRFEAELTSPTDEVALALAAFAMAIRERDEAVGEDPRAAFAEADGQPHDVALICEDGQRRSVEAGP